MDKETLVEELGVVGLEEDQARAYLRLLQLGPSTVGQLSQYFDSSRSTLYRLLDELAEIGYVSKSLERPTSYRAAPPDELFGQRLDEIERDRQRVQHLQEKRLGDFQRLAADTSEDEDDCHWRKMEGTERIYEALHSLIEGAEASIWAASNHETTTARFLPAVEEAWRLAWKRAEEDSIDVRFLFDLDDDPYHNIPEWLDRTRSLHLRQLQEEDTVHFILCDTSELLMWVRPAPLGSLGKKDDVAVATNAPGSVVAHRRLFEELWADGEPIQLEA